MKYIFKLTLFLVFSLTIFSIYIFSDNQIVKAEDRITISGLYRIENVYSKLYLDIEDGSNAVGALAIQAQGSDNSSQIFKISKDTSLRYIISIEKNLKVIEIKVNPDDELSIIQQGEFSGDFNQVWDIRVLSDDSVVFINYLTNEVIGIDEGELNSGSFVKAQEYVGTDNQKWILEPVGEIITNNPGTENISKTESIGILQNINSTLSDLSLIQIIIGVIFIFVFLFFALGQLLYGFRIKPRLIVKGKLFYKPLTREDEKFINYLDFKRKRHQRIVISFDQQYKKADFYIGGGLQDFQLIFEKVSEMNLPHFLEGYRSFNKDKNPIKIRVTATEPGILNFGEFVYSKHFIVDGSKFNSGGILFRYVENEK